jgi:2-polyprenyl-3-methyl-5-hydroxy-6-metoxy-1,4-benzoquinol methylase
MKWLRTVGAERLDVLAVDDPAALRSRHDLQRLHRVMGTRSILVSALRELLALQSLSGSLRLLELGAGDGQLMLDVARRLTTAWPRVELTLLDRQNLVSPTTLAGFEALGWTVQVQTLDVLDWAAAASAARTTGSAGARWDLIVCNLFLHHFEGAQLDLLLSAIAASTERLFACEPRRAWIALAGSHLVGAVGANAVTREDAVLSVRAGFRGRELAALWASQGVNWTAQDYSAGLFSHCFSAQRIAAN